MSHMNGVAAAIVKEIDKQLGRVKVNLPWLSDENETYWARVATMMAGKARGSWFMPEIGDEVLIAFEMGKVDHPYVLGYLWSETDTPPIEDDTIDEHVRRMRTTSNHQIDFDDRDSKEKIKIQSHSKHVIEMNDTSEAFINIQTNGNRSVKLDDQGHKIQIKTAGAPSIELDDQANKITAVAGAPSVVLDGSGQSVTITMGGNSITVDATGVTVTAAGPLSIKGATVSVESAGPLSLTGSTVTITGAVLSVSAGMSSFTGPVQTTSVISPAYTPGVGNLL
jgi:uncharacterized protein involved in type VI secretion and phage assembly